MHNKSATFKAPLTPAMPQNSYTYNPLYRIIKAEGRALAGNNQAPDYNDQSRTGITPIPVAITDTDKMRRYTQYYQYDNTGNFIQMQHTVTGATGNWTRYYNTAEESNQLLQTTIGTATPQTYTYDSRGNLTGGMSHLNAGAQSMIYNDENRLEN